MPEPGRLDHAAAQWCRRLLVLAGEIVFADRAADLLEHRQRLARRVQGLALPPREDSRPRQRIDHMRLVRLGDRRKAHDVPILLRQHVADQIVLVQPVHDQDDGPLLLVVEAAVEGVVEPLVGGPPVGLRQGLLGFQRVVDDDDVRTPPGQHPADRSGEPAALGRGFELGCRLPLRREPGREQMPVPVAGDDAPAIARQLVGEVLGIADAEDLGARPVTEAPGRKGDRGQVRLQVARRQVDDQPPDLALVHRRQLCGDDPDMPARREIGARVELVKAKLGKAGEIVPQQHLVLGRVEALAQNNHLAPLAGRGRDPRARARIPGEG